MRTLKDANVGDRLKAPSGEVFVSEAGMDPELRTTYYWVSVDCPSMYCYRGLLQHILGLDYPLEDQEVME